MRSSPFSLRGLLIGTALSLAIGLLAPYGIVFNYFWIGFNPSSPGALFFLFVFIFITGALLLLLSQACVPIPSHHCWAVRSFPGLHGVSDLFKMLKCTKSRKPGYEMKLEIILSQV